MNFNKNEETDQIREFAKKVGIALKTDANMSLNTHLKMKNFLTMMHEKVKDKVSYEYFIKMVYEEVQEYKEEIAKKQGLDIRFTGNE